VFAQEEKVKGKLGTPLVSDLRFIRPRDLRVAAIAVFFIEARSDDVKRRMIGRERTGSAL
jgi:hypothetical protein